MRAVRYVVLSSLLAAGGCGGMEQSQDEQSQDSVDVQPAGKGGGIASEFVSTAAKPSGPHYGMFRRWACPDQARTRRVERW